MRMMKVYTRQTTISPMQKYIFQLLIFAKYKQILKIITGRDTRSGSITSNLAIMIYYHCSYVHKNKKHSIISSNRQIASFSRSVLISEGSIASSSASLHILQQSMVTQDSSTGRSSIASLQNTMMSIIVKISRSRKTSRRH